MFKRPASYFGMIMFKSGVIFSLILVFAGAEIHAQLLRGRVVDSVTQEPLNQVHIATKSIGDVITGPDGAFTFAWGRADVISLTFTLTGYAKTEERILRAGVSGNDMIDFRLVRSTTELRPVEINSGPQIVYQHNDLHVGDYLINNDGVWVLVYDRPGLWHKSEHAGQQVFKGACLHLLDTLFNEKQTIRIPMEVIALHHDVHRTPIIEGRSNAWAAALLEEGVVLTLIDKAQLHRDILPWTDSIPGYLIGNNVSSTYPAFDHIAFDPEHGIARAICSIQDDHLLSLFRSQYKYMSGANKVIAMNLEDELGVDKEIIAGYMTAFYDDLYFKVPYAPLFVMRDTLCVFDTYKGSIRRFATDLEPISDVPFTERYGRDRWKELIQDEATGYVYARFQRGSSTWLCSVNKDTGSYGPMERLLFPFPEEIQVYNGYVYYVYRPYGSLQHRALYREAIR